MIKLKVQRIIDFFDYPQLFIAKDIVNTSYICMLVDSDEHLQYIATKISPRRLYELETNRCDLRYVFEYPELDQYFSFNLDNDSDEYFPIDIYEDSISDYLPENGLYVGHANSLDDLKELAVSKNKYIYKLHLLEEGRMSSVSAALVSSFLVITQKIVKNSFIQGVKGISKDIKKRITESNSSEIGVFAFSEGSLNVLFSTNSYVDMFGNSDDGVYLSKLKEIINVDISDVEQIKNVFRNNKGHLISALEQLCKKIIDSGTIFELMYSAPNKSDEGIIVIDKTRAKVFHDFINTDEELKDEVVDFSATFVQADVEKGNWRIRLIDEEKEISGKSSGGVLAGITLEYETYKILCHETLVADPVSGDEKKNYELISYDLLYKENT